MGCGASAGGGDAQNGIVPEAGPEPALQPTVVAEEKPTVAEAPVTAVPLPAAPQPRKKGTPPNRGPFLPFVRFDTSAVPKGIRSGEEIYLQTFYSSKLFTADGEGPIVAKADAEFAGTSVFVVEKRAGGEILDGDDVLLRHAATGLYLTSSSDHQPCSVESLKEAGQGLDWQRFQIFKQGRPFPIQHRDTVYLQTWLSNYVEASLEEGDCQVSGRQWRRGEPQTLTVLKKAVVEQSPTELARKMQFQAFDLDGNKAITRAEIEYILKQVQGDAFGGSEEVDRVMGRLDPAATGLGTLNGFIPWADSSEGLSEEQLQHAEVIGNVAQRCRDCLYEEECLIEVLTTIHSLSTPEVQGEFQKKFGLDLAKTVTKKASEQDGFIFTNYWKQTMGQLMAPRVNIWVQALNDAMNGFGTDENTLTALVCTIPDEIRDQIHGEYKRRFGRTLMDHIDSETSLNYKKVLLFQARTPVSCRAGALNDAMVGLGTDETQLIRVICACDLKERKELCKEYQRRFDKDLVAHVESETSGDFKKSLVAMLTAEEQPFDLDADCEAMKKAMDGWGTDEGALIKLICSKTSKQMEDVNIRFEELYGKRLFNRVRDETSGYFQEVLMGCIRHPMRQFAYSVRDCIAGWGTDDTGLITLLTHLPEFKRESLHKTYREIHKRDLQADIASDTSGDYKRALLSLVKPAPQVWAEAIRGSMKGIGTADNLLINFMVLAKDDMAEVRSFFEETEGRPLFEVIKEECSGDYAKTLIALSQRNSEDRIDMVPVYWAQRCKDALNDVDTLKTILTSLPAVALKRGTEVFEQVYKKSLKEEIEKKCKSGSSFFGFSNYWKDTMTKLLMMPVECRVGGLYHAMKGWGTDEFTLTGLVCTIPENMYEDVHQLYRKKYNRSLTQHIESETSFNYGKLLKYQSISKIESRCMILNAAMVGLGTSESQIIRVLLFSTMKERELIQQKYAEMYGKGLIEHIESETSGSFQAALVAILESTEPQVDPDLEEDAKALKEAMDGIGTDEDALIRILAGKTPGQIEELKAKFEELTGFSLFDRVNDETFDYGAGIFLNNDFRETILGLLRTPARQLAYSVRDCIKGWGTDDTGLITCLVHLTEMQRKELVQTYAEIPGGGDIYAAIKSDTSGDYERALLACVKPPPQVYAEALLGAMKGIGTDDELLINWMCIAKDRMDEVRAAFLDREGTELAAWIASECSGDYKDTLVRLAKRECMKFPGQEVGITIPPPPSKRDAVRRFNITFNECCRKKRGAPEEVFVLPEEAQQEMGNAFLYYATRSGASPNLDKSGLWEMTNDIGFPPADDGPDLDATFREWDYSGSGDITWNDFVREMSTRINDPNHFEADPLDET